MYQDVLSQAEKLGETILDSEAYKAMRTAEMDVTRDENTVQLIAEFSQKRERVENILADNQMDHNELAEAGEELEAIEKRVNALPLVENMQKARAEFTQMMEQVNQIIRFVVTGETGENAAQGSCNGSCEGCGGCGQH